MLLSLEQILGVVAKSKGVSNPKKWVEDKLTHCELSSDYFSYIHLKSNKNMWFGIRDTKFECQPFVLFREYINNDSADCVREFEIYTFRSLKDKQFLELLKDSYEYHYDIIEDLRVFFETQPVLCELRDRDGELLKLKKFYDLDEGYTLTTNLFHFTIQDSNLDFYFCSKDLLEIQIINLRSYNQGVDEKKSTKTREVYLTDNMIVMKSGDRLFFELSKTGQGFDVTWV